MKGLLRRLCCLLLIICLLPVYGLAAETPASQAGERKFDGGQRDFKWPVPGVYNLSSCFLDNRAHYALDIAGDMGSDVIASYDGVVVGISEKCVHNWGKPKGETCCSGWGNYILLQHNYTLADATQVVLYSRYAHLTDVLVTEGQTVTAGEKIGTVGSTGRSTGPHLDYEILWKEQSPSSTYSVDPYVNDLLELPEELHTTFGPCCQEYVAYVKTLYPRCAHSAFDDTGKCVDCGYEYRWKDTWDCDAMGNYTVAAETQANVIPYAAASGTAFAAAEVIGVNATVVNGQGQTWYEVTLADQSLGYVPQAALSFHSYFDSKIESTLTTLTEGQIIPQASHRVDGIVTSDYPLRKLTGYLDGNSYGTWTGEGSNRTVRLAVTEINWFLQFSTLEPGEHTLTVTAEDSTGREPITIITCTFYVEASEQPTEPEATLPTIPPATEPTEPEEIPLETNPVTTQPATIPAETTPGDSQTSPDDIWLVCIITVALLIGGFGILFLINWRKKGMFAR